MHIEAITVKGDKDLSYTITTSGDAVTCTCPAYRFSAVQVKLGHGAEQHMCKHIEFVAGALFSAR